MDYLDNRGLEGFSTDITINKSECGKERPDRIYHFGDKIIILECDKNQHKDRICLCEQTRLVNKFNSFEGIPVYFTPTVRIQILINQKNVICNIII